MPCSKCNSDFTVFNWKLKCGECEYKYCNKCLKRKEGILYCEVCLILIKRPPDRLKLMELKVKDLRDYLNKNNISTYGLVEKKELVDLLCNKHIPEKQRNGVDKLTANFGDPFRPINEFFSAPPPQRARPAPAPPNQSQPRSSAQRSTYSNQSSHSQPPPPHLVFSEAPSTAEPSTQSSSNDTSVPPTESAAQSSEPLSAQENGSGSSPVPTRHPKLEDFGSLEELTQLTPKQLKILLTINRVDFKGCIEKHELLEKAQRLWEDKNQRKDIPENLPVDELCKLCMDAPLDCVLLECGHITSCIECGKKLAECPICRQYVVRVVRTFKA